MARTDRRLPRALVKAAIFPRSHLARLAKAAVEIGEIVKAAFVGRFGDGNICLAQKPACLPHPAVIPEINKRMAGHSAEKTGECFRRQAA